jgi:O-6-methylguanine DNA methyltransferase
MTSPHNSSSGLILLNAAEHLPEKRPALPLSRMETPFGTAWIGTHEGRVAWLSLGELEEEEVRRYWKGEFILQEQCPISLQDLLETAAGQKELELLVSGTKFQMEVWSHLLRIPFSTTVTYGEIATELGSSKMARAVGTAVGANPIAWLIPCHRVLPSTGGLGGYRWGQARKESLLKWESRQNPSGAPDQDSEDRRKLEAMLVNAQRFEDTAKLAGDIAHDLNNLLAPIRMATELLKRKLDDPSVNRYIEIIETSTSRARSVIQEILAYARESETSGSELIDVNPLLHELEKMAIDTFRKEIRIEFKYQEDAPLVELDPHQLHRSILNLLVNAEDAISGSGTIKVEVSTQDIEMQVRVGERCMLPGRFVCISVSDTGSGIKPDIRDKIFNPFFTTKPKEKGTGLGLSSVFGIAARAGGYIDLDSVEGEGTSFHLFLPEAIEPAN